MRFLLEYCVQGLIVGARISKPRILAEVGATPPRISRPGAGFGAKTPLLRGGAGRRRGKKDQNDTPGIPLYGPTAPFQTPWLDIADRPAARLPAARLRRPHFGCC